MQKKNSVDRIVELLVKIHTGKLDDVEQAEMDAWFAEDAGNRALYRRLSDDKYLQEQYSLYKLSEYPDGWEELKRRMAASEKRKLFIGRLLRCGIAAAVVLAAVIPLALFNDWSGVQLRDEVAQDFTPGRNEAVIELETGEKIALDQKQSRSVKLLADAGSISGDSLLRYDMATGKESSTAKHTLYVPKGAAAKIVILSDKTRIWINAGSSITYPVHFSGDKRTVTIDGEGYFDVAHDAQRSFVVEIRGVAIRVMGTQFNVMSYAEDRTVETTLVTGCVSICAANKEAVLLPGVQAVYNKDNHDIALRDVDVRIYTAWKEGIFESNNMTIENIAHVLSRWYDVEFVFENPEVRFMRFNGTIKRDKTLEFTLDRIRDTKTINYKIENGKVIIMKK